MPNSTAHKIVLSVIAMTGIFFPGLSQKKYLTEEQLVKGKMPALVIPLPQFISWADDNHLVFDRKFYPDTSVKTITIDPATGHETVRDKDYSKKGSTQKRVFVKEDDLYYSAQGKETRLTNNKELEKIPALSPDSNSVAFTRNNNLYVIEISTGKETQLTSDGNDSILNGYASWVYFEEILNGYATFWWSPDNKHIAFFRSDDGPVPVFTITDGMGQHGLVQKQRYPKAGDKNPEIKIGIVSLNNHRITWADFNPGDDQYFGLPYWKPDGSSLLVQWMNRDQNNLKIYDVNVNTGAKKELYNETTKTWISLNNHDRLSFIKNGYIILSDKTGWRHIYYYDKNGAIVNPVTSGRFSVTGIVYIDEKKELVFFTARKENSARSDFYSIRLNGKDLKRLTFGEFNHNIMMSPSKRYFITTYNNISTPSRIALLDNTGKLIKDIADAKGPEFGDYEFANTELIRVKSEDGLFDLPVTITWPQLDLNKRYPVLVNIYGGPGASSVMDAWGFNRLAQLYAKQGLIFISIDHRGSGHFGKEGQDYMYRNLGYWEMKDYSSAIKWLIDKGYADSARVGIIGYSYGGYLAAYALTYGADVFTHGMAGSAVTDWSLYDTHYTERYMGTPMNNPEGYKTSSALTYTNKYKGRLLISHGAMDDNVHLQNSLQLNSKLLDLGKEFDFFIYSGGTHGNMDMNKQIHFQNSRIKFIYKYLLEKAVPEGLLR